MSELTGETRIRLMVLDDQCLFRASLGRFLASEGFEIAGECGTASEALKILKHSVVDVILMDFNLASERAVGLISAARETGYEGRFLMVASAADARSAVLALKLGASGIFLKAEAPELLVKAIRLVAGGEMWIDQKVIHLLAVELAKPHRTWSEPSFNDLEDREQKVLDGILSGLTNKHIGRELGLSESAVKNLVQRLFAKAGVKNRSQLVRVAIQGR